VATAAATAGTVYTRREATIEEFLRGTIGHKTLHIIGKTTESAEKPTLVFFAATARTRASGYCGFWTRLRT